MTSLAFAVLLETENELTEERELEVSFHLNFHTL
jgi:hypothetical protein